MTKVKVLIEGYAKQIKGGWLASSTTTLVQQNGLNLIVDPGCNRVRLVESLAKNGLMTSDINYVLLTHGHTDHALLAGMFENARALNDSEIYEGEKQVEHGGKVPGMDLEIVETPGHSGDSCSLIVKSQEGTIVVAGDVFWWKDAENKDYSFEALLDHKDVYVEEYTILRTSRKRILEIADYIIPGHGKMFKVLKK